MSSPQSFMFGPPASAYAAPLMNFANLAQLPQTANSNAEAIMNLRARQAFQGGVPTLPDGSPDLQTIFKKTLQLGGAPAAQALLPYIYSPPGGDQATTDLLKGGGSPPEQAPPYNPNGAGVGAITGRPPSQTQPGMITGSGTRTDPYIIHDQQESRLLQTSPAYREGSYWQTPNGNIQGIKGQPAQRTPASSESRPSGTPDQSQEASGQAGDAASSQTSDGAPAPVTREMGQWPKDFAFAPRAQRATPTEAAKGNQISPTRQPTTAGPGGPIASPGGAGPSAEDQAVPRAPTRPERGGGAQGEGLIAARPPLPPIDPAAGNAEILANERSIGALRARAAEVRRQPQTLGRQSPAADLEAEATRLQEKNATLAGNLRKPYESINAARAEGFRSVAEKEAYNKAIDKASAEGQEQLQAINGAAFQIATDLEPHIKNGKDLLNSPNGPYTGFGAGQVLQFNQAKQIWGNTLAATPQEAFQKTVANVQLGLTNMERFMARIGGVTSGRMFQSQIQLVSQASASLGNTVAGNRFLLEMADRSGKQIYAIQKIATDYLASNHPYLDQGFNQKVVDYVRKHPLVTTQEAADPQRFLAAPEVPEHIARIKDDGSALRSWQHSVRVIPGSPVRAPDGHYFKGLQLKVPVGAKNYAPNPPGINP